MTPDFLAHLANSPDPTAQTVAECLSGLAGGQIGLSDAIQGLDDLGAPSVAFEAVRREWREFASREKIKRLGVQP